MNYNFFSFLSSLFKSFFPELPGTWGMFGDAFVRFFFFSRFSLTHEFPRRSLELSRLFNDNSFAWYFFNRRDLFPLHTTQDAKSIEIARETKKKKKNAGSETGNSDTRYFFPFPDTTSFQACGRCDIDDAVISVCLPTKRIKQTRRSDDDWNKDSRP